MQTSIQEKQQQLKEHRSHTTTHVNTSDNNSQPMNPSRHHDTSVPHAKSIPAFDSPSLSQTPLHNPSRYSFGRVSCFSGETRQQFEVKRSPEVGVLTNSVESLTLPLPKKTLSSFFHSVFFHIRDTLSDVFVRMLLSI